jgi:hypothetical protein
MTKSTVFQFKITLQDIKPFIWRRVQIPGNYTFWDLHVAIQDSMGWTDTHLHEFRVVNLITSEEEYIGIPDDDGEDIHSTLAGWEIKVKDYVKAQENHKISYLYDFGDSWKHIIEFEGEHEKQPEKYPQCLAGERACPPEDVGGVCGYQNFLSIIQDTKHEERKKLLAWVGGKYDPEKFDPKKVKFDNSKVRWKTTFTKGSVKK